MATGIQKHRLALEAAVEDPEYCRIAAARVHEEDPEDDDCDDFLDDSDAPIGLQGRGKYTRVWSYINDVTFFDRLAEYVALNADVVAAINMLGSDSALLSDAAMAVLKLNQTITAYTTDDFPMLLGNEADLALFKAKWQERMMAALKPHHYLAVFLDPRKHVREWVLSQPCLIGSAAAEVRCCQPGW
jgi:hypothetical protein